MSKAPLYIFWDDKLGRVHPKPLTNQWFDKWRKNLQPKGKADRFISLGEYDAGSFEKIMEAAPDNFRKAQAILGMNQPEIAAEVKKEDAAAPTNGEMKRSDISKNESGGGPRIRGNARPRS